MFYFFTFYFVLLLKLAIRDNRHHGIPHTNLLVRRWIIELIRLPLDKVILTIVGELLHLRLAIIVGTRAVVKDAVCRQLGGSRRGDNCGGGRLLLSKPNSLGCIRELLLCELRGLRIGLGCIRELLLCELRGLRLDLGCIRKLLSGELRGLRLGLGCIRELLGGELLGLRLGLGCIRKLLSGELLGLRLGLGCIRKLLGGELLGLLLVRQLLWRTLRKLLGDSSAVAVRLRRRLRSALSRCDKL